MGYYMHQTGGKFILRRGQIEHALDALREAGKVTIDLKGTFTEQLVDVFHDWS